MGKNKEVKDNIIPKTSTGFKEKVEYAAAIVPEYKCFSNVVLQSQSTLLFDLFQDLNKNINTVNVFCSVYI